MSDSYVCTGGGRHNEVEYYSSYCPVCELLDRQPRRIAIKTRSDCAVELVSSMGNDNTIVQAARVSTRGQLSTDGLLLPDEAAGVINYLMKHRHGTPFEHGALTFFVRAPIFVWREWHRHRIGMSYNEESARYKQLDPEFWIPDRDRPLMPVAGFKSAKPEFGPATDERYRWFCDDLIEGYLESYSRYQRRIENGYAKEAARAGLTVGIYSSCWVTCNPRSLMHFLSLRTKDNNAMFKSYPQYEIEQAARQCEAIFQFHWPITYNAWQKNGRVAP